MEGAGAVLVTTDTLEGQGRWCCRWVPGWLKAQVLVSTFTTGVTGGFMMGQTFL